VLRKFTFCVDWQIKSDADVLGVSLCLAFPAWKVSKKKEKKKHFFVVL